MERFLILVVFQPTHGRVSVDCTAFSQNVLVEPDHRMMLGITVAFFRLSGCHGQHDGASIYDDYPEDGYLGGEPEQEGMEE